MPLDPITGGEELAGKIVDVVGQWVSNKDDAQKLSAQLLTLIEQNDQAQTDVDKVEAASTNWFIAGWRPGLGWICDLGIGCNFVLFPLISYIAAFIFNHPIPTPNLNTAELVSLVTLLIGGHATRTVEKYLGVAT